MATSTEEIIKYLQEKFPQPQNQFSIDNCADLNFNITANIFNQYILGVTPSDQFTSGIRNYEHHMMNALADTSQNVKCVPWPFHGYENNEMKMVLVELSEFLAIDINPDNMIKSLKIPRDETGIYYIVITIVQYNIATVQGA